MPGLVTDHEFLYFSVILNVFPRLSKVWGTCPPTLPRDLRPWPDPSFFLVYFKPIWGRFPRPHSIRDLRPRSHLTSGWQFGEIFWDNPSYASDIIRLLLFVEHSLRTSCSSHIGTFDGKPGNKKMERLFKYYFWDMYSGHLAAQWLFRYSHFPNAVFFVTRFESAPKFATILSFPTSVSSGKTHLYTS